MGFRAFAQQYASDVIHSPYDPRPWQVEVHRDGHRFVIIVAHRRAGKTFYSAGEVMDKSLRLERENMHMSPPQYAFIAPTNEGAKKLGFNTLRTFLGDWPHTVKESLPASIEYPSKLDRNIKITVDFIGAHRLDLYRGRHLDGVVVDEFGEMPGRTWKAVVFPMLSDYKGWARLIGTPKGKNEFYQVYKMAQKDDDWGVHYYPADKTGIIDPAELALQLKSMGPELYGQEYELDWMAAVFGAYYAKQIYKAESQGRITHVPYDPDFPVHTGWDLGVDGMMVTWFFQQVASQVRFVDFYQTDGMGLEEYFNEHVLGRKDQHGRPYRYGDHYFPHDLAQREPWQGKSLEEMASQALMGNGAVHVVLRRGVADGIEVARKMMPNCWFDQTACEVGLEMLSLYRAKYDEKLRTATKPLQDASAHAADAFRQVALGRNPAGGFPSTRTAAPPPTQGMSMDAIMRQHGLRCPYYPGGDPAGPLEDMAPDA